METTPHHREAGSPPYSTPLPPLQRLRWCECGASVATPNTTARAALVLSTREREPSECDSAQPDPKGDRKGLHPTLHRSRPYKDYE